MLPNIQAPGWASPYANELLSEQAEESGWNRNRTAVQRFSLVSQIKTPDRSSVDERAFTVLLVEDNPADARLVREALEEHGVSGELILIGDGESAILYIKSLDGGSEQCPALAIVDLNLPKRSGGEVVAAIRCSERCAAVPVVVLSSSDNSADQAEAERRGASRYIRKPSRLQEFLSLGRVFKVMASRE